MNASDPDYFGSALDLAHCEVLTIQHIDAKLLAPECALYARKWFDYRPLHPAQATYLMAHHYNRAYGDFIDKARDHDRRFVKAFKGKDYLGSHERRSFWRLRQKIDELGMRYEFFLRAAMNWYIDDGWGKGAPHPPRPAHLASNSQMQVDVANAWANECRARIQYAQHPRYAISQWVGAPDQIAYETFLIEQIRMRPHPRFALHAALYLYDALRIEAALANFPAEVVNAAAQYSLDA